MTSTTSHHEHPIGRFARVTRRDPTRARAFSTDSNETMMSTVASRVVARPLAAAKSTSTQQQQRSRGVPALSRRAAIVAPRATRSAVVLAASTPEARAAEAQAWIDAWKNGGSASASASAATDESSTTFEMRRGSTRVADGGEGASLSTTSFGTIGLGVGLPLLLYGFCAYFNFLPGSDVSALMLIYGFPISLIGFALKYAELEPLTCVTYDDALKLRDSQTTPILTQVRSDVTRFRYGDEQHLEEALKIIFRFNRPGGLRRNQAPELTGLSEQVINDRYALCLEFESPKMEFSDWTERVAKITSFFGPGVIAYATKMNGDEHKVEIALITTGTGGGEMQDMEVLPPLAPGLPPRYVKRGTA